MKEIKSARSKQNGIIFYSNIFPHIGLETTIDESGNLQKTLTCKNFERYYDSFGTLHEENYKVKIWKVLLFDIILIILSIAISFFSGNPGFAIAALYFSSFVSFQLFDLIKFCYDHKSKRGTRHSTAAFHAAEHMAINAYEKLQRIPTLEEIKNFSRFHRYCGSRFIFSRICSFLMLCLSMAFFSMNYEFLYLISIGIIIVFIIVSGKYGLLNFLQIFVTNKPSDKELLLAIEGLKQFEIIENFFQDNKDSPLIQQLLEFSK